MLVVVFFFIHGKLFKGLHHKDFSAINLVIRANKHNSLAVNLYLCVLSVSKVILQTFENIFLFEMTVKARFTLLVEELSGMYYILLAWILFHATSVEPISVL